MSCKQEISSPSAVLPVISTSNPPRREIGSDDAPSILDWRGRMVSWWIPRSVRVETGQTAIWAPVSITEGVVVDLVGFLSLLEKVGGARPSLASRNIDYCRPSCWPCHSSGWPSCLPSRFPGFPSCCPARFPGFPPCCPECCRGFLSCCPARCRGFLSCCPSCCSPLFPGSPRLLSLTVSWEGWGWEGCEGSAGNWRRCDCSQPANVKRISQNISHLIQ